MLYQTYLLFLASSASAVLLPNPTGLFSVGVSVSTLTDETRMDPFAPDDAPHKRKVLVSTFIPLNTTTTPCVYHTTPYMTPLVAEDYGILASSAGLPNTTFSSLTMQLCDIPQGKPCSKSRNERSGITKFSLPLVLFSPGFGQSRLLYSAMARSLASEGYVVVTVDHPYDASVVEFTDGSFVTAANISTDDEAALEEVIQVCMGEKHPVSILLIPPMKVTSKKVLTASRSAHQTSHSSSTNSRPRQLCANPSKIPAARSTSTGS